MFTFSFLVCTMAVNGIVSQCQPVWTEQTYSTQDECLIDNIPSFMIFVEKLQPGEFVARDTIVCDAES